MIFFWGVHSGRFRIKLKLHIYRTTRDMDHKATGVCVCVRGVFGCIICMIFEVQDLSAYLYQYITLLFGMEEEIAGEHHSQPTPE